MVFEAPSSSKSSGLEVTSWSGRFGSPGVVCLIHLMSSGSSQVLTTSLQMEPGGKRSDAEVLERIETESVRVR